MEAHNAVVDVVREAGMIKLRDLALHPKVAKFYSDQGPEKPGAYDPIKYGGRTVNLVFWKPLLVEFRRPRIEKETNA